MSRLAGVGLRALPILLCLGALAAAGWEPSEAKWVTLKNCRLVSNPANDGDSFHVVADGKQYLFRLYFVDAPEVETLFPDRVREQGMYFGISDAAVIQYGKEARTFTRDFLKEPFTVRTRMQNARGMSKMERFFATVECGGKDLGEALVRNGLGRAFGAGANVPDGPSERKEWAALDALEKTARGLRIGAWKQSQTLKFAAGQGAKDERKPSRVERK